MRHWFLPAILLCIAPADAGAQRDTINLPDIPGYVTLKGDFHMHTVFSDGQVWPSFRSYEANRDGLDFIAITEHIDFQGNPNELSSDYNKSYGIAAAAAAPTKLIVIRGAEISPRTAPYHANALFLTDANLPAPYMAERVAFRDEAEPDQSGPDGSIQRRETQGAFITYNTLRISTTGTNRWAPTADAIHRELMQKECCTESRS